MNYQNAHGYMKDLQRILTAYRFMFSKEFAQANGKAIIALEKQIPEKAIIKNRGYEVKGEIIYLYDEERPCCPRCGNAFAGYKYCDYCGQRVERSDGK